jgi:hypothetical protein
MGDNFFAHYSGDGSRKALNEQDSALTWAATLVKLIQVELQ